MLGKSKIAPVPGILLQSKAVTNESKVEVASVIRSVQNEVKVEEARELSGTIDVRGTSLAD